MVVALGLTNDNLIVLRYCFWWQTHTNSFVAESRGKEPGPAPTPGTAHYHYLFVVLHRPRFHPAYLTFNRFFIQLGLFGGYPPLQLLCLTTQTKITTW